MSDLPPGWAAGTLSDLIGPDGLFTDGDWVETKDQDAEGSVRLTQLADVGEGLFRDRSQRYMREDQAERLHCTYLAGGDILVARMPEPLGRACLFPGLPQPAVTAVDVCIVRPGQRSVDSKWLMWTINAPQFRARVEALQTGTTRKRVSRKNLAAIRLPLPPLAEQRRIVAAIEEQFSRLDHSEGMLGQAALRIARMKLLVLADGFAPVRESAPLRELADVRLGRQRTPKNHFGMNMKPYLRAANVTWQGLSLFDVKEMHFSDAEVRLYELHPGDVLLAEASGSASQVGKPAVWRGQIRECCFQNTLIRVRSRGPLPEYLRLVFLHAALAGHFAQASPGVGIHHLGAGRLSDWPIPVCSEGEQAIIVEAVDRAFSLIDALRAAVESAQNRSAALRRAILERAFRGELVPQDPADEPASVLLERVRAGSAAVPRPARGRAS